MIFFVTLSSPKRRSFYPLGEFRLFLEKPAVCAVLDLLPKIDNKDHEGLRGESALLLRACAVATGKFFILSASVRNQLVDTL